MKKLILFLIVAGALGTGTYYYLYDRLPWQPVSPEEQQVDALQDAFNQARQHWREAGHTAALGVDASTQVDPAVAELDRIQADLEQVTPRLASHPARLKASQLRREVAAFRESMH
jgi:hypothetical protein